MKTPQVFKSKLPYGILALLVSFSLTLMKIAGVPLFQNLSWWWIAAPVWLPVAIVLILFLVWLIASLVTEL